MQTFTLAAALTAVGDAELLKGDPWTGGGLVSIGAKEGDVTDSAGANWNENALEAIEHTGNTPHQVRVTAGRASFVIGLIAGQQGLMANISPTGSAHGPPEKPTKVVEAGMLLVPRDLFASSDIITYNGSVFSPVGIDNDANWENVLFIPRGYTMPGAMGRPYGGGGKGTIPVTVTAMYYGAGTAGKRGWVRGKPWVHYPLFRM